MLYCRWMTVLTHCLCVVELVSQFFSELDVVQVTFYHQKYKNYSTAILDFCVNYRHFFTSQSVPALCLRSSLK